MFTYTRTLLKQRVNAGIKGKIDMLLDVDETLNDAAREVVADCHLRSSRRQSVLASNLFEDVHRFPCPEDTDGYSVIDFLANDESVSDDGFFLVPTEEFRRRKNSESNIFALDYVDNLKTLLLKVNLPNDSSQTISALDSLTADGGTWQAYAGGENIRIDTASNVEGAGMIGYDINNVSESNAGIVNNSLNPIDISTFVSNRGSIFVWAIVPNPENINNFTIQIGQDVSNYYQMTTTTAHSGNAIVAGKNLLRFDFASAQIVGSVDTSACTFVRLFQNKETSKVNQDGFGFDYIVMKTGESYSVKYQSKYPWVDAVTGAWKQESDDDLDLLVADADEFKLFRLKATELAAEEVEDYTVSQLMAQKYEQAKMAYEKLNPSEVKIMTDQYHNYEPQPEYDTYGYFND